MGKYKGIKMMNITHKLMLAGQIAVAAVLLFLVSDTRYLPAVNNRMDRVLQVVGIALTAIGFFGGMSLFKKKLLEARDLQAGTAEKFGMYRTACFQQWALLEGPSLFNLICFYITGNYAFLGLVGLLMILFAVYTPSRARTVVQLNIAEEELADL